MNPLSGQNLNSRTLSVLLSSLNLGKKYLLISTKLSSPGMRRVSHLLSIPKVHITDPNLPIYSGAKVKLAFYQKPYILRDGVTYGTSLKLVGVQLISINSDAGVDSGDLSAADVADLFGTTAGFKASEPNVTPNPSEVEDDEGTFSILMISSRSKSVRLRKK